MRLLEASHGGITALHQLFGSVSCLVLLVDARVWLSPSLGPGCQAGSAERKSVG